MKRALIRLVDFYRTRISPGQPARCRFEPSCSAYAREALEVHGACKGSLLAVWRILRCNPLTARGGTIEPIPHKGKWRAPKDLERPHDDAHDDDHGT